MNLESAHIVIVNDDPDLRILNQAWVKQLGVQRSKALPSFNSLFAYLEDTFDTEPVDLILAADQALYEAKAAGRNQAYLSQSI